MSTIQEVAEKAGVSISTVYKVFDDNYDTRPEISERVLAACKDLDYVHRAGSMKRGRQRKLLGLMFSEPKNPFTNELIQMILEELRDEYEVMVFFSNEDTELEARNVERIEKLGVDALIFATVSNHSYPIIEKMVRKGRPVIQFFMQTHHGADSILFDDEMGTYRAVKHLIQNGHQDILMLYKNRKGFPQRAIGYKKAFQEVGLRPDDRFLYDIPYEDSIRAMIQSRIHKLRPTAILAVNEIIATATVTALREMRLALPQDISLIIYDDLPWAAASGITTVGHAFESAGVLCKSILSRVQKHSPDDPHKPVRLVIDPKIIARDSVRILEKNNS